MALLSRLKVSDSVILWFEAPVLKEAANVYDLINKVTVTASYDNNEERPGQHLIPVNTEDLVDEEGNPLTEDEDRVHIPGTPDTTTVKLAILDETDSGLDIDALRIVATGVTKLHTPQNATVVITHYQRLLDYIVPDVVHVLYRGRIIYSGDKTLALKLEKEGYDWLINDYAE